jgi:putative phosphoserine phosphatase/1-acylglycerol-3-phosphate O-acyltransferase
MVTTSSKRSKMKKDYYAFFDLDHTITGSVSGKELVLAAYKKGLLSRLDLVNAFTLSLGYRIKLIKPAMAIARMGKWVKGLPAGTLDDLSSEIFSQVLIPSIYPQVWEEITFHREKNAGIVILSSTITPLCRMMARHLGIDDTLCSDMEDSEGILTGRTIGDFCFGEEKAIRLKAYCEKNNSSPEDAWYYGDSMDDLPVLKIVGNPVCINPGKKLSKIAVENGWKIYFWK